MYVIYYWSTRTNGKKHFRSQICYGEIIVPLMTECNECIWMVPGTYQ